jgi:hypothetical protein
VNSRILVVPYRQGLLERLSGYCLVIRVNDPEEIQKAEADAQSFRFLLHCVQLHIDAPLASVPFEEAWSSVPLALFVPSLGRMRDLVRLLPLVRRLNLRVYLPADTADGFTAVRLLSSLGVPTAVDFSHGPPRWDLASDLATYALLGLVPHAPIEPFQFLTARYRPAEFTDFGSVLFDDPARYLHLDEVGRVAVSAAELTAGEFIADHPAAMGDPEEIPAHRAYVNRWRSSFLRLDGCAICQAWRICRGRFASGASQDQGCRAFFSELMGLVEQRQALGSPGQETWQP